MHLESIIIRNDTELIARYFDMFRQLEELTLPPDESGNFLNVLFSNMPSTAQPLAQTTDVINKSLGTVPRTDRSDTQSPTA